MALLTLTQHKAFAGIATNDPVRDASLQEIIEEAVQAVKNHCQNGELERTQYTVVLDAPSYPSLVLPFAPVVYAPDADTPIDFELYLNTDAAGDPSAFTSDHLLEIYQDYTLDFGPANVTVCRNGIVRFVQGAVLTVQQERPLYSLHTKVVPARGAFKVVYTAGYTAVELAAARAALNLIVRKVFNARKLGLPITSESLNGYSYASQGAATVEGLITGDPTVRKVLSNYCRPQVGQYA